MLLGSGCGADDLSEKTTDHGLASQSAEPRSDPLYFGVRPDLRRCDAPACGGSFVRALNREQTTCADGSKAAECYVAELDLHRLGLSEAQAQELVREQGRVVVAGAIRPAPHGDGFGSLVAERAYRGVNDTAAAATLLTTRTGIVCITAPCPTHEGRVVNHGQQLKVDPNLTTLQATPDDLERVKRAIGSERVLLSGRLSAPKNPTGVDALFDVTQAYVRVDGVSGALPEYSTGTF